MSTPILNRYSVKFSVLISKYGDPVHDDGMKLNQMYKSRIAPLFKIIDGQWKAFKAKDCAAYQGLVGLCVSSKIKPKIANMYIQDQYPEEDEGEGGGDGHKERFKGTASIHFIMHIVSGSEQAARESVNAQVEHIVDNMDCDLCEYADDFEYSGISEIELIEKGIK